MIGTVYKASAIHQVTNEKINQYKKIQKSDKLKLKNTSFAIALLGQLLL